MWLASELQLSPAAQGWPIGQEENRMRGRKAGKADRQALRPGLQERVHCPLPKAQPLRAWK